MSSGPTQRARRGSKNSPKAVVAMEMVPPRQSDEIASRPASIGGGSSKPDTTTTALGATTQAAGIDVDVDTAVVDRFFSTPTPLDYGQVTFLEPVPVDQIDQRLRDGVTQAPAGSKCIRIFCCVATAVIPVFGWIAMCAKAKYVKNDEVALANELGSVYVLPQGCHLHKTYCRSVNTYKVTDNVISETPVNLIRVLPGTWGMAENNGKPVVLKPGRHFISDPLFKWERAVPMTDPHVHNRSTHIITIDQGQLGLAEVLGVGHILEPGRHIIDNENFIFHGIQSATKEYVAIRSKHRVMVPTGRLGLAWDGGDATLLTSERVYYLDNNLFRYVKSVDILDAVIEHGSIKIITVNEGLLGIAFDDGQLRVLPPGRHVIDKATFMFSAFLSTGQETLPISQITSLSADNVGLSFSAAFSLQVVDALKAVTMLGRDLKGEHEKQASGGVDLPFSTKVFQANLRDRARLALSIIIGNNKFTDTFLSTTTFDEAGNEQDGDEQGSFKGLVHDMFMAKFADEMLHECGVKIIDISIENIVITSRELAHALAQAAVKATELEMSRIDNDVEVIQAQTEMKSLHIRTEGRGVAQTIKAAAESNKIRILALAEAGRIQNIDQAIAQSCASSKQREMILVSGEALKGSNSTLIFSDWQTGNDVLNGNMHELLHTPHART